ncbi:hypothetical protein TNCV_1664851 [Trichonephila clavipes]|uniref:Uncharacterized protein n=1 Tax=Trichonephila clavipes TaxID=2585209 RepID=A0A8X6RTR7_TRICX|nr:hypothetical protein TNCV_1664851 [Trichonephila clavipes]
MQVRSVKVYPQATLASELLMAKVNLTQFQQTTTIYNPCGYQHFLEKSAYIIDRDIIIYSNFQKHPYGYQVTNLVNKNDANLAVSPIFCQISIGSLL